MSETKVFKSVALFVMLTGSLNTFPWVVNSLVKFVMFIHQLVKFSSMKEFSPDRYFSKMNDLVNEEEVNNTDFAVKNSTLIGSRRLALFRRISNSW